MAGRFSPFSLFLTLSPCLELCCFENMCIIYEFVFHKLPNKPHDPWLMSSSNLHTNSHMHHPLCGEERKDELPPNICFAYLPWPVCVYIFEEVWARGIHQYISTVMALSVSVETLPDVIQISTGFFHGRRRVWPAILSSAYRSDLNSRNLFNTDLVLYCLLNQTHGYIPRQLKRSHPALGHCHSCFEMCGECL